MQLRYFLTLLKEKEICLRLQVTLFSRKSKKVVKTDFVKMWFYLPLKNENMEIVFFLQHKNVRKAKSNACMYLNTGLQ